MRIALDVMGGDHAPTAILEGVRQAAEQWPDLRLVLIGREEVLRSRAFDPSNVELYPVTESIEAGEEPIKAIRRKKDSSIVVGCRMVKEGKADAFISAGNTGALMAAGLFYTGRLPGIDRPALAPVFPTMDGRGVLVLDVGANPEAKPEHLAQYARMGAIYSEKVLGVEEPRVGLLNIGTEEGKGTDRTKKAYGLLSKLPIRYIGNVEARDVLYGVCDVLVCDGFSGNILLKSIEGAAKAIFERLKAEFTRTWLNKLAAVILKPGLKRFAKAMDYTEHGGAPLLGLSGAIVKAHGSSDANAIANAIRQARRFVEQEVISQISDEVGDDRRD